MMSLKLIKNKIWLLLLLFAVFSSSMAMSMDEDEAYNLLAGNNGLEKIIIGDIDSFTTGDVKAFINKLNTLTQFKSYDHLVEARDDEDNGLTAKVLLRLYAKKQSGQRTFDLKNKLFCNLIADLITVQQTKGQLGASFIQQKEQITGGYIDRSDVEDESQGHVSEQRVDGLYVQFQLSGSTFDLA